MRRTVSLEWRYGFEAAVGLITMLAALVFGDPGFALGSVWAFSALTRSNKPDEREVQLMHKANTGTLFSVYLSMFPVYFLLPGANWIMILYCSLLFFHGLWNFAMLRLG